MTGEETDLIVRRRCPRCGAPNRTLADGLTRCPVCGLAVTRGRSRTRGGAGLSAGQWWVLTLGVGLLAGFLGISVMLPDPRLNEPDDPPTRVTQRWSDRVSLDQLIRVRIVFEMGEASPAPAVTFYLDLARSEGVEFVSTEPQPFSPPNWEGRHQTVRVPADPLPNGPGYQAAIVFRPTRVGDYRIPVRYRIGAGGVTEFLATGKVLSPAEKAGARVWE